MSLKVTRRLEGRRYSRRDFLKAGGGALLGASALSLAGCGGGNSGSQGGSTSGTLTFQTWAGNAEEKGFRQIIKAYEKKNSKAKINLQVVPFGQMYQKLQTTLAAGNAPDLARIQYQQMGFYSSKGALLDLSSYLPKNYGGAFTPALWSAVTYKDKPYGVPQHTDTMAIYYNVKMLKDAGVTSFPQSPDEAWTWDEFTKIANKLKKTGAAKYPFAVAWQDSSSYRWLWFLFQHGGQLLTDDLSGPMINNAKGVETIAFTQSFFKNNLVPPSTSVKASTQIENLFSNNTIAMMLDGDWLMPFLVQNMKATWDVTYMIRDAQRASDLGGNAVVATKDAKNPTLAADFLKFLASPDQMKQFCITAQFIPTREKLVQQGLDYKLKPKEMNKFVQQSKTVPAKMAAEQTVPSFSSINQVLTDQLEAAFKTGQSPKKTAKAISDGIKQAIGS